MESVSLGFRCNNACVFCAQGDLRASDAGVTDASVSAQLASAIAAGAGKPLAFVGGEPTLHEALPAWISQARALGAGPVLVQTNGRRLAYASYAQALARAGVHAVDVSLHGSTAAMHDHHTGVPGSFAQTVTGLGVARAAGLQVGVTVVITRSNYRHLVDIVRVATAKGASAIHFVTVAAHGRARSAAASIFPPAALLQPHLAAALHAARVARIDVLTDAPSAGASEPSVSSSQLSSGSRFAGIGEVERLSTPAGAARRLPLAPAASYAGHADSAATASALDPTLPTRLSA